VSSRSEPAGADPSLARFRALLLASGVFNIVVASPLVLPWTYGPYLEFLSALNRRLGLGGVPLAGTSNPAHALLINTAGIDLVLIGLIIVYAAGRPLERLVIVGLNAAGRTAFFGVVAYYVVTRDLPGIVMVFGLLDLAISLGFAHFLRKIRLVRVA
jgi:hypothetical protein